MKPDGEDRMPNTSDPTEELRAFFRDEARDDHPEGERLVAYHERRLSPEEQEEMRRHLAACPDCAAQLRELAALLESEMPPGPALSPARVGAAWERFAAGMKTTTPPEPPVPFRSTRPAGGGRSYRSSSRWAWGIAAVLAVTTAALSALALHQGRLLQDREDPPMVSLLPEGKARSGTGEPGVLTFKPDDLRGILLLMPPDDAPGAPTYTLDFENVGGQVLTSRRVTEREIGGTSDRTLSLEISRSSLPPGHYSLVLRGSPPGRPEELARYKLVIRLL